MSNSADEQLGSGSASTRDVGNRFRPLWGCGIAAVITFAAFQQMEWPAGDWLDWRHACAAARREEIGLQRAGWAHVKLIDRDRSVGRWIVTFHVRDRLPDEGVVRVVVSGAGDVVDVIGSNPR